MGRGRYAIRALELFSTLVVPQPGYLVYISGMHEPVQRSFSHAIDLLRSLGRAAAKS